MTKAGDANMTTATIHKFQEAGLGVAPFRIVGVHEARGPISRVVNGVQVQIGAPGQPMGTCQYCGQGIAEVWTVRDRKGTRFTVGSTCVNKAGDAGLKRVVAAEKRKRDRAKRHAREARMEAELRDLLEREDVREKLAALPHNLSWLAEKGETLLDSFEWTLRCAGARGICEARRALKTRFSY